MRLVRACWVDKTPFSCLFVLSKYSTSIWSDQWRGQCVPFKCATWLRTPSLHACSSCLDAANRVCAQREGRLGLAQRKAFKYRRNRNVKEEDSPVWLMQDARCECPIVLLCAKQWVFQQQRVDVAVDCAVRKEEVRATL